MIRTATFDRRADQGLAKATISTSEVLTRHSAHWQSLTSSTSNDLVVLPDATTLPEGWAVIIQNVGDVALEVEDDTTGTTLATIPVDEAVRAILTDNGDADGEWFIEPMILADAPLVEARYTLTHDATTDWGSATGGYYSIAVAESTHGRGTRPTVQTYETDGSNEEEVVLDESKFATASGDYTARTAEDPDLRYAGKIIFI